MRISDWSSDVCSSDLAMPKKLETERPWRKMKQVVQRLDSGETQIIEAPAPANAAGHLLIRTTATLISAGTERMLVDFGKSSMLAKARQQPERVKEVLAKVRTGDGRAHLSTPVTN